MYAAVVENPGHLVVKDVPKPSAGKGEFVLKVLAASICNATDNHIVEGIFEGYHDFYPQVLGHEVCGRVVEIGPEVDCVQMGDRIVLYTPNGAFAEYVLVTPGTDFAHVPDAVTDDVASICEMFLGSFSMAVGCAGIKPGEKVLVMGAGPMGLAAASSAKVLCGADVSIVDFHQNRLDMALSLGVKRAYNHTGKTADEIIEAIRADVGEIDTAVVCVALDRSAELDAFYIPVELVRYGGKITGLNVEVKREHHNHHMNPFHLNRKNIHYQHFLSGDYSRQDFARCLAAVADGSLPIGKLITHRVSLSELPMALDLCHNHLDQCIKCIVYPTV